MRLSRERKKERERGEENSDADCRLRCEETAATAYYRHCFRLVTQSSHWMGGHGNSTSKDSIIANAAASASTAVQNEAASRLVVPLCPACAFIAAAGKCSCSRGTFPFVVAS